MTMKIALAGLGPYTIGDAEQYESLFAYASQYELIDRLYRRYVRKEDIDATKELVEKIFDDISFDKEQRNEFIRAYNWCIKDMQEYLQKYGEYVPIRIVNVEGDNAIFYVAIEIGLPLEEYDNLKGDPFWMDPFYMEERYEAHQTPKTYDMSSEFALSFIRHIVEYSNAPKEVCGMINEILSKTEHLKYIKENRKKINKKKLLQSLAEIENDEPTPELITAIDKLKEVLNEDGWLYKRI